MKTKHAKRIINRIAIASLIIFTLSAVLGFILGFQSALLVIIEHYQANT